MPIGAKPTGEGDRWRQRIAVSLDHHASARALRHAALDADLATWTRELTSVVVDACEAHGWRAAAKGHPLDLLPKDGQEYLSLDVMAFDPGASPWPFPVAVMELENSKDPARIAYSLWKVLCVRCPLRVVYCYRPTAEEARELVETLRQEVIAPLAPNERLALGGETMVTVGLQGQAAVFPHGFFRSWLLDLGTGQFRPWAGGG